MKNSSVKRLIMMSLMMAGMASDGMGMMEEPKPTKHHLPPKKLKPFKEQSGVKQLIKDFKEIQEGKSKKGKRKQGQIKSKIQKLLESRHLMEEDLNDAAEPAEQNTCKYVKRYGESCTLNNNCKYPNCD